jgi:hypothetical protein
MKHTRIVLGKPKNSWYSDVICGKIPEMVHEVSGHESSIGEDEEYIKMLVGTLKDM